MNNNDDDHPHTTYGTFDAEPLADVRLRQVAQACAEGSRVRVFRCQSCGQEFEDQAARGRHLGQAECKPVPRRKTATKPLQYDLFPKGGRRR